MRGAEDGARTSCVVGRHATTQATFPANPSLLARGPGHSNGDNRKTSFPKTTIVKPVYRQTRTQMLLLVAREFVCVHLIDGSKLSLNVLGLTN